MQKIVERHPPDASSLDLLANPKYRKIQKVRDCRVALGKILISFFFLYRPAQMAIWTADRDIERDMFETTNKADYSEVPLSSGLSVRKKVVTQKETGEHDLNFNLRDNQTLRKQLIGCSQEIRRQRWWETILWNPSEN